MTAIDYLSQTWQADRIINVKLEEVQQLRSLAEKATSVISMSSPSGTRNVHRMEDTIVKMVDLQNEIAVDIERLLAVRKDITDTIGKLENVTHQALLKLRYLCYKDWSDIAVELSYHRKYILQLHKQALKNVEKLIVLT